MRRLLLNISAILLTISAVTAQNTIDLALKARQAEAKSRFSVAAFLYRKAAQSRGDQYLWQKALENYIRAKELDSAQIIVKKLAPPAQYLWAARIEALTQNPEKALEYLEKYMTAFPDYSEYQLENDSLLQKIAQTPQWKDFWTKHHNPTSQTLDRIQLLTELKENLNALEQLQQLDKELQNSSRYHQLLADNYFDLRDYRNAVKHYQKAWQLNPNFDLLLKLAKTLSKQNNCPQALSRLQQAYKMRPYNLELLDQMADCYIKTQDFSKARQLLRLHLQQDSTVWTVLKLAETYYLEGDYISAIQTLNKVLTKDKTKYQFFTLRGQAYYRLGKMGLAYKDLSMSLDLNPAQPQIYYLLGDAAYFTGHKQEGCSYWRQSFQVFHNPEAYKKLRLFCKENQQ